MNDTDLPDIPTLTSTEVIKSSILGVIFVISFVANTWALCGLYRKRGINSSLNKLLLNLAIADLMVAIFCDVTDAIWTSTLQWYAGDAMCRMIKFIQVFSLYLSTYVIVIIATDRCAAVVNPLKHNNSSCRIKAMVASVWIISAILSLPQAYIFSVQKGPFKQDYYQCVTHGSYSEQWQEEMYMVITVLANYIIPLFIIIISYLLIVINITNKSASFTTDQILQPDLARKRVFNRAKVRSIRMTALIVLAFIICWTPYQVSFIVHLVLGIAGEDNRYTYWIFCFGMTNSMFNPMIYGAFHFRNKKSSINASSLRS